MDRYAVTGNFEIERQTIFKSMFPFDVEAKEINIEFLGLRLIKEYRAKERARATSP